MTDPITPPPELVQEWIAESPPQDYYYYIAEKAAQWGADQELEATLAEVSFVNSRALADRVRAVRRPKPPSLKEQALEEVGAFEGMGTCNIDIIRRALEALPDD